MKAIAMKVHCFDCPECHAEASVNLFIAIPPIWACASCKFWFERRELVSHCRCEKPYHA